jgi:glycosyltransferase involved in cell wall biosynthesis
LAANPDLANLDMNLLVHYLNYGRYENRRCSPHYIDGYKLPFPPRGKFNTQTLPVRNCRALSKDLIVGIHLHCHFVDVAVEMIKKLKYFPGDFRLFVSVTSEKKKQEIQHIFDMEELTVNRLIVSENRGRDISPMLVDFSEDLLNCDVCLHLHTKKSKEREKFGLEWRRDIESKLLFNCNYIGNILSSFENNPNIGILAPEPFWKVIPYMHTGANKEITDYLLKKLGVNVRLSDNEFFDFPAGSMFWFRPKAIDQLLKYNFQYKDFPKEPIPDDGTLAHAVERCLILVCKHNAFDSYNIKPLPYEKSWPGYLAPKISIVVPVYNAQAWIKSTIESVLEQDATHVPYELILVENGSTDGSDKIARHYADLFDNIKYVEEKIKGAGDARNAGIRNATGDYITFLDADDILATDALGNMFAAISSEKADVVVSSLVIFDEDGYSRPLPYDSKDNNVISFDGIEDKHVNVALLKALFSDFGPCAKLYRREFLSKQQISFPSGRNFEDNWFIYCVYLTARRIAILQGPTYFYRKYQQLVGKSQSTSTDEKSLDDQIWVIEKLLGEKLGETKEDVRIIVKNALVTKLGWEFNRLELSSVAYERLSNSDFLLQEIHSEGMWLLLGDKANELKTMHENVISCKDGS